jgi:hypothetical protein
MRVPRTAWVTPGPTQPSVQPEDLRSVRLEDLPSVQLEDLIVMKAGIGFRARRGWDIAMAVAIAAVVSLGWLTAPGGTSTGAPHPRPSAVQASPSALVRPGGKFAAGGGRPGAGRVGR